MVLNLKVENKSCYHGADWTAVWNDLKSSQNWANAGHFKKNQF